jgi:hypothetical protein
VLKGNKMPNSVIEDENLDPPVVEDPPVVVPVTPSAETQALIDAAVKEALKPIKEKLDGAYRARDLAIDAEKEAAKKLREAEIAQMKADGLVAEALEAEKSDLAARLSASEERNLRLTRDGDVKDALGAYEFRTPRAQEMAKRDIISELKQDADGNWKHTSGASIEEFVTTFMKLDDNSFLLKPKTSTGLGMRKITPEAPVQKPTSLFGRSQADVMNDIAEGKITRRKR